MNRCLLASAFLLTTLPAPAADPPVVSRIAFGSCAKQDKPQPIWDAVVEATRQGTGGVTASPEMGWCLANVARPVPLALCAGQNAEFKAISHLCNISRTPPEI